MVIFESDLRPKNLGKHSPDLNLTPLAAFLRFLPSAARLVALGKNRKKAARGVRFKAGLGKSMTDNVPHLPILFPAAGWYLLSIRDDYIVQLNTSILTDDRFLAGGQILLEKQQKRGARNDNKTNCGTRSLGGAISHFWWRHNDDDVTKRWRYPRNRRLLSQIYLCRTTRPEKGQCSFFLSFHHKNSHLY